MQVDSPLRIPKTTSLLIPNNTPVSKPKLKPSRTTEYSESHFQRMSLARAKNVLNLEDTERNQKKVFEVQEFLIESNPGNFNKSGRDLGFTLIK